MELIVDWSSQEIGRADTEARVEMWKIDPFEARRISELMPEKDSLDEIAQYLDQAQETVATDGRPKYLILKISQ